MLSISLARVVARAALSAPASARSFAAVGASFVERERACCFLRSVPFKKEGKQKISKRTKKKNEKLSPSVAPTIERSKKKEKEQTSLSPPSAAFCCASLSISSLLSHQQTWVVPVEVRAGAEPLRRGRNELAERSRKEDEEKGLHRKLNLK